MEYLFSKRDSCLASLSRNIIHLEEAEHYSGDKRAWFIDYYTFFIKKREKELEEVDQEIRLAQ